MIRAAIGVSALGLLVLVVTGCGGPALVPARAASDSDVRAVLVAEARVANGRARALDPTLECGDRRRGVNVALRGALRACDTARHVDDRDLAQRCFAASRGAQEAVGVVDAACGAP